MANGGTDTRRAAWGIPTVVLRLATLATVPYL